ncbi:MAG: hypothetical protein JXR31_15185 [Prolixibacteraceae bacterium]|nr:hypothetical protein [Prolixibacteraceae bacterium]
MKSLYRKIIQFIVVLFPVIKWYGLFKANYKESLLKSSPKEKLWAFRKGYFPENVKIWEINRKNYMNYLDDKKYFGLHPINKKYTTLIDSKLYLPYLLKDYPHLVPEYYAYITKGRKIFLDKRCTDLIELCLLKKKLVFKLCRSSKGIGFFIIEYKNGDFYRNNNILSKNDLLALTATLDDYIITEYVEQHPVLADIYEHSVNTVRFLCIWDKEKDGFFIPRSAIRFGMDGKIIDNTSIGSGVVGTVDEETGMIKKKGLIKYKGEPYLFTDVTTHPNTGKQISGVIIPNFQNIKSEVLEVMNSVSFIKFTGMDLAITQDGFKILELNSLPALTGLQMERPFLTDARIKQFFYT